MMTDQFTLSAPFEPGGDQPQAISQLVDGLTQGLAKQVLFGVTGSGKTFTMAHVIQTVQRPAIVIAPNKTLAAQLYSEFKHFFPNNAVEYFVSYYDYYQPEAYVPSSDTYIEKDAAINDQIEQMRLSATKAILERKDTIVVASVSAIYGLGDPKEYLSMVLHVARGEKIDQRAILHRLAELQYTRNDMDFRRSTYRVRGDVIDIFPAESENEAVRIELFDDEIESLSYFDPLTGESHRKTPRLTIYPKTHYVTSRSKLVNMTGDIKKELKERLKQLRDIDKLVEAQRLEQRTRYDMEMITELGYCSGIENYSRYLSGRQCGETPPTLMEYLPPEAILIIDESHVTVPQIGAMSRGDRARKQTLVEHGFRLPSALDNRPLMFEEFENLSPQTIYVSATPGTYERERMDQQVNLIVRPTGLIDPEISVKPIAGQIDDLLSEIKRVVLKKERVLITTLTKRMAEDLSDYLSEQGVKVRYLHSDIDTVERVEILRDLRLGVFDVLVGINLLREGLDLPEVSLVAILDADKQGFLRSERSLVQTIGRAARHIHGRVIMYADKITDAMQRAMTETQNRRTLQSEYNKTHGITPKGIVKAVHNILETTEVMSSEDIKAKAKVEEEAAYYASLPPQKLAKKIKALEEQMYDYARNLEFEDAAKLRDQIKCLRDEALLGTRMK